MAAMIRQAICPRLGALTEDHVVLIPRLGGPAAHSGWTLGLNEGGLPQGMARGWQPHPSLVGGPAPEHDSAWCVCASNYVTALRKFLRSATLFCQKVIVNCAREIDSSLDSGYIA